jgi:hypothetical protein
MTGRRKRLPRLVPSLAMTQRGGFALAKVRLLDLYVKWLSVLVDSFVIGQSFHIFAINRVVSQNNNRHSEELCLIFCHFALK